MLTLFYLPLRYNLPYKVHFFMKKTLSLLFVVAFSMLSTMPAMAQFNLKNGSSVKCVDAYHAMHIVLM